MVLNGSVAGVKITDGAYLYSPTCVSGGNVKVNGGEVDGYGRVGEAWGGSAQHNSGKEQHCEYPHSSHDRYFFKIFEVDFLSGTESECSAAAAQVL